MGSFVGFLLNGVMRAGQGKARLASAAGLLAGTVAVSLLAGAPALAITVPTPPQGSSFCFFGNGTPVCFPSGHPPLQGVGGSTMPPASAKFSTVIATPSGGLEAGGSSSGMAISASVRPGTSPAILTGGDVVSSNDAGLIAYQGSTGILSEWTAVSGAVSLGASLQAGTNASVAITGVGNLIAGHGSNGDLWLWSSKSGSSSDQGLAMASGTSPSITATGSTGWEAAFQGANGDLWTTGSGGTQDWGLGMMAHTSPSITELSSGFQIAFQANTGDLWIAGTLGTADQGLGMAAGTSPAITFVPGGGVEVAFQANTGHLWIAGNDGTGDTGETMKAGTNPALETFGSGELETRLPGHQRRSVGRRQPRSRRHRPGYGSRHQPGRRLTPDNGDTSLTRHPAAVSAAAGPGEGRDSQVSRAQLRTWTMGIETHPRFVSPGTGWAKRCARLRRMQQPRICARDSSPMPSSTLPLYPRRSRTGSARQTPSPNSGRRGS